MSIKSNVTDAVLYVACATPLVVVIVLTMWLLANYAKVYKPVANEVANEVVAENATTDEIAVNNTANRVTTIETEVYRVVCVEEKSGYCGAYSVRRIVKE